MTRGTVARTPSEEASAAALEAIGGLRVAVLIPCKDEEPAIARVVLDFVVALPQAVVYVYDNNSLDRTAEVARAAGARIRSEPRPGKGNVVRRMFNDVEADIYLLVDGDDTYDANSSPAMIAKLVNERLDMVSGARQAPSGHRYRVGHQFGNGLLTTMVGVLFGERINDLLSGYRVFSRRFVKSFPAVSTGFEIETELTVHALEMRVPFAEMATPYKSRREGSASKLNTFRDGFRILLTMCNMAKGERPLFFSFVAFALLFFGSLTFGRQAVEGKEHAGPTVIFIAILSAALMLLAFLCLFAGLILDSIAQGRRETRRLRYLDMGGTQFGLREALIPDGMGANEGAGGPDAG
jgi:glycosyltransferase involved in cell wall biosynthesis